jgi:hypothetical protein
MEIRERKWKVCDVLSICLFIGMLIISFAASSKACEVPLSPYYTYSNKDWWLYQFWGYENDPCHGPYTNHNCGPASAAMTINYLTGRGLTTEYGSFEYESIPNIHCTARGYYCSDYLKAEGYPEEIYGSGYYNNDWSTPGAWVYQIRNALSLEDIQSHVIKGTDYANVEAYLQEIENAVTDGKLSIACVNPTFYVDTQVTTHWTVIYGYDENYIYLNDPGWNRFRDHYPVNKSNFLDALWSVEPATWRETIIIDSVFLIFYVPDNYPTIQAAIDDCNDSVTIVVRDGIHSGNGNRDIDFKGKTLTLCSENGPENCIIDCNGSASEPHRGFYFHSSEDANSVLEGFTITNGYTAASGGAIYCTDSSPTIRNCRIIGNSAVGFVSSSGGGIKCTRSSAIISDCTIVNNVASGVWGSGGGINCNIGSPTIKNCVITGNSAPSGGGISSSGSPVIENCQINDNSADTGGGIFCSDGPAEISNCVISGNKALIGGGVHYYFNGYNPTITNCTIAGNWATRYTYDYDGGGGIYCDGANPTATNCIVWDNKAGRGSQILLRSSSTLELVYSDVEGGEADIFVSSSSSLSWDTGNMTIDPLFANSGYWDANGTPGDSSDDFWVNGDYHLKSQAGRWNPNSQTWIFDGVTSRCIDAGNPGSPLGDESVDENNTRVNMGAYGGTDQASKTPSGWSLTADITNDGTVEFSDLVEQFFDWLMPGGQLFGDLNHDGKVIWPILLYSQTDGCLKQVGINHAFFT